MNRLVMLIAVALLTPAAALAQSLNGNADWGYVRSGYRTGSETTEDGAFTQAYTLAYSSSLWDPRFAVYSGGVTFNRNALSFGANDSRSQQTGFNAAASLFSMRPFRLAVHANRAVGAETANYPASSALRAGLEPTPGATPGELATAQSEYGVNWVLSAPSLPRVEFSYAQGGGAVAAGPLESTQSTRSVHALVSRERPRLSNTLRYDHHAAANSVSAAFDQQFDDIGYELVAKANDRTRADVRAGRRTTSSRFHAPIDPSIAADGYRPPDGGDVALYYTSATLTHQPNARFAADASFGFNDERSSAAATGALLTSATARLMPFTGLTLRGSGTYGQRRQEVAGVRAAAITRAAGAGTDYGIRYRAVHASAGVDGEEAWNRSDTFVNGRGWSWRARTEAGVDLFGIAQLSAGLDRDRAEDQLLTLGNQRQERAHASARALITTRMMIDGTYERAIIDRGVAPTIFQTRYTQALTTMSFQVARERRASLSAGEFVNRTFAANERHRYIGVSFAGPIAGRLRASITARRERTVADFPRLDQDGAYTFGSLDYRLRLFTFSVEYRYTDLALITATQIDPLTFNGHQLAVRIGRKFGMGR
ncbi:MAG TPA: hypothetical protein VKD69_00215 [Vicinamibacterales bacterium]|nr:hypothetical protein [Vicinamibacterales bacterium]